MELKLRTHEEQNFYFVNRILEQTNKIKELEAKVEKYEQFIKNGVDGGYIQIPDKIDPAYKTIIELTQPKEKN